MTVATQLEILDLRHFSARQLRPLLETEARLWEKRLRWNYLSSTELLLQYLDSRILPGFVALERGRVCGFSFCVYEGHKAVVGDAFATAADPAQALTITHTLLHHLIQLLLHSPTIKRVEAQLLLYDAGTIEETFVAAGFSMHPRLFMEYNFPQPQPPASATNGNGLHAKLPTNLQITQWAPGHYQAAAELIHQSYIDHIDSRINDQYCSLHGSLRFLHNIVRFPGCGVFDPNQSWVLEDRRTGAPVGLLLCSRVARETSPTSPSSASLLTGAASASAESSSPTPCNPSPTQGFSAITPHRHRGQRPRRKALRRPRLLHPPSLRRHGPRKELLINSTLIFVPFRSPAR